jgi:MFS family permease
MGGRAGTLGWFTKGAPTCPARQTLDARLESPAMRLPLERTDLALLAAYLLAAALGTWQSCLLVNDGAIYLTAAWLGDAWDLFFDQNTGRVVSTLFQFGPAWALRPIFGSSSSAFIIATHCLYFAGPLVLWLILRAVEPHRVFSRLYLAISLAMIYFTSEMIAGIGLWLVWLALLADPTRTRTTIIVATAIIAPVVAFTHPGIALLSLLFALVGGALYLLGRSFSPRLAIAAAAMGLALLVAYLVTSALFHPSNPTVAFNQGLNKYDYIDPLWLLATLALFPMLAALWLLLLAPGLETVWARRRLAPAAVVLIAVFGLWFAAAGTGLLTWLYARHTAGYVLALALALALVSPATWLLAARRPLMLYAAVAVVGALSYNVDLFLFGRFVDSHFRPGIVDVDAPSADWPARFSGPYGERGYFKWVAARDYQRDVVVPIYDWYQVTLAFYSFFRSNREGVLFHSLGRRGDWIPFECAPISRTLGRAHDEADRRFLAFLATNYCVR